MYLKMRSPYALYLVMAAALAFSLLSCGKKEETTEKAPAVTPAAAPVDLATVGSVSGTVKLDGPAPKPKRINMAAEPSCAAIHASSPAFDEEVVEGRAGGMYGSAGRLGSHINPLGFRRRAVQLDRTADRAYCGQIHRRRGRRDRRRPLGRFFLLAATQQRKRQSGGHDQV